MQRVHRTDLASEATGVESTPQGGVRVRARIARTGVLRYRDDTGREWGEYRPPEEVFAAEALATARGATVTDLHPQGLVTAASYRDLNRGHAHDDVGEEDGRFVVATLAVNDADLARKVLDGERRDVSAGYTCEVDPTPGVSPEGEKYDGVQRAIRINHIALGPRGWGRSGVEVGLRMDGAAYEVSAGSSAAVTETNSMKRTLKVRGVVFRLDGDNPEDDKAQKAIDAMEAEGADKPPKKDAEADAGALGAALEAAQTALVEATGEVAKLRAQIAAMASAAPAPVTEEMVPEEVMDAAVAKREQLRADAAVILSDVAPLRGKKPSEIRRLALAKVAPTLKLDGIGDDVIARMFDAAVATARSASGTPRNSSLDKVNEVGNAPPSQREDGDDPAEKMMAETLNRWQEPTTVTVNRGLGKKD